MVVEQTSASVSVECDGVFCVLHMYRPGQAAWSVTALTVLQMLDARTAPLRDLVREAAGVTEWGDSS